MGDNGKTLLRMGMKTKRVHTDSVVLISDEEALADPATRKGVLETYRWWIEHGHDPAGTQLERLYLQVTKEDQLERLSSKLAAEEETVDKYVVKIIERSTKKAVKKMGPMSFARADKVRDGVRINLDTERFYTTVEKVEKTP